MSRDKKTVYGLRLDQLASLFSVGSDDKGPMDYPDIRGYDILHVLGEGGMGNVYLAREKHPIEREVALKVIKPGMNSQRIVARFESEKQTLALLDHAHIARVFSAGTTEMALPYFAMEYVKGIPIAAYCDHNKLTIHDRLTLFLPVCQAVQHAHQKGVIHRDLKPSNILITVEDNPGHPKIIDFGVAKTINLSLTDKGPITRLGQMLGTPEYMSPEQADLTNTDIDTRSDIYSLGVILYELLVGALPFSSKALRTSGPDHGRHTISEDEVPRPSMRLTTLSTERSDQLADLRQTDSRGLSRSLKGDLDWIILMAMAKERMHRYGSAGELAADIRRHLNHEPVSAGPPTFAYQWRKLLERYRRPMVSVGIALAILMIGFVVNTALYIRSETLRIETEHARRNEATAKAEIEAVTDYLMRDLLGVNPEQGMQRLQDQFKGEPLVNANNLLKFGDDYLRKGMYVPARQLVDRAHSIRREQLGPEHPDTLTALSCLGKLDVLQCNYAQAEVQLTRALAGMVEQPTFGSERPDVLVDTMLQLNLCYFYQGKKLKEFFGLLEDVHETSHTVLGKEHPLSMETQYTLAMWLQLMGAFENGLQMCEEGRALCSKGDLPNQKLTIKYTRLLAMYRSLFSRHTDAEALALAALDMSQREFGPKHPLTLHCTTSYAYALHCQFLVEKTVQAEQILRRNLAVTRDILGANHYLTFHCWSGHIDSLICLGRFEEAQAALLEILGSQRRIFGEKHEWVLSTIFSVIKLYAIQGKNDGMKVWCESEIQRQGERNNQPGGVIEFIYVTLAWVQASYPDPAIRNGLEAVKNAQKASKQSDNWRSAKSLAAACAQTNNFDKAIEHQNKAIKLIAQEFGIAKSQLHMLQDDLKGFALGQACWESHFASQGRLPFLSSDYEGAEKAWQTIWKYSKNLLGESHAETQGCVHCLIQLYEAWDKPQEAQVWRTRLR
jgi:eukaryotic-like serine/threonine-protein kinase